MYLIIEDIAIDLTPFFIVLLLIGVVIMQRRGKGLPYVVAFTLFGLYLILAMRRTLFPMHLYGEYVDVMREEPFRARISLLPFFLGYGLTPALLINIVLNVILTIPFGFGLNFLVRLRPLSWIFLSLLVGGGIEATQLALSLVLGYAYRVIDIHDAFANTLGVLLGYALFLLFALAARLLLRMLPQPHGGLARYLKEVVGEIPR